MVKLGAAIGVLVLAGCQRPDPPPLPAPAKPAPAVAPAPDLTPIIGKAGPLELLPDDGIDEAAMSIAAYQRAYGNNAHPHSDRVVVAEHFPAGLSKTAAAGIELLAHDKNVSWVIDG